MISFFLFLCAFLCDETRYAVTDLGVLPNHQSSRAFGVNNHEVVVGESVQGFISQHAFLWKTSGVMGEPVQFALGQAVALGVSDSGHIIGTHYDENGQCHGWIWQKGNVKDIGTLGGSFCAPYAVNSKGVVVGVSHNADYQNHAFIWCEGLMTDLFPQADFSVATDINEYGDVIGYFQNDAGLSVAFLRSANGKITELDTLGGEHSNALGLNNLAQVVGFSSLPNGHHRAFLFENGKMRDLGALANDAGENDTTSEAFEINNQGVVIGESVSLGAPARAFVWSRAEGMRDLQKLILRPTGAPSFHLERVSDINDSGQIVGWGYFGPVDKDGNTPPSHAVLLTPLRPSLCPQALPSLSTKEGK